MNNLFCYNNKSNNDIFKNPVEFVDLLDKNRKHIVLYYENERFGKYIQFKFLKNGLSNSESCIYCIYNKDNKKDIENEMINNGIDVDYFSKRDLLTIFKVPNLMKNPKDILKRSKDLLDKLFYNINPKRPFRLVIRMIECLDTKENIEANLMLEQYYHSKFDSFNGKVLCYYNFNPYTININNEWSEIILQNHHSAIFITDNPEIDGIAFEIQ